jgi:hypothetical protein
MSLNPTIYDHHLTALLATVCTDRYVVVPCNVETRQILLHEVKKQLRAALSELIIGLDVLGSPEIATWSDNVRFTEMFVCLSQPWRHNEAIFRLNKLGVEINGQQATFRPSARECKAFIDLVSYLFPAEYGYRACTAPENHERVRLPFVRAAYPPSAVHEAAPLFHTLRPTTLAAASQTELDLTTVMTQTEPLNDRAVTKATVTTATQTKVT